ncbi:hypothetical protein DBR17_17815 [Sphingomonas sp. HMWF008]|nr:hypothetical protein DBR17_17815 [Sphingomonas sp. HMWF008]
MNAPRTSDALAHLDEAMDALTLEGWLMPADGFVRQWTRMEEIEMTIAEELKRVDGAIGGHGKSMFALLGQEIIRAVVEIEAARRALRGEPAPGVK